MLKPEFSGQFKRDYKQAVKRGCDPKKLETVITMLCAEQPLPAEYRDHALTNSRNYKGMRECHIQPDWLLVYRVRHEILSFQHREVTAMKQSTNKKYEERQKYKAEKAKGHILLPDTVRFICEANGYDAEKIGQHFLEILPKICPKEE